MKIRKMTPREKEEVQTLVPVQIGDIDPVKHAEALKAAQAEYAKKGIETELPKNG